MTSTFDKITLRTELQYLIDSYKHAINQFVQSKSLEVLNLISNELEVSLNTLTITKDSSSGYLKGYDIILFFKLYGVEVQVIINRKGFCELKYSKYTPAVTRVYQYLPGEEMKMIELMKTYFKDHQLKSVFYINRICGFAVFQNNHAMYTVFNQLANEIEEYSTSVVGFKDQRFPFSKYLLQADFCNIFNQYKYSIAYKNNNKMIILCVEVNKTDKPINLAAFLINLDTSNIELVELVKQVNSSSIVKLLDFFNS